jgi:hypothetical protein
MCTKGHLTVQGFASSLSGFPHRMIQIQFLECGVDAVCSPVRHRSLKFQHFCQEAVMWKRMAHPNIVPLLGITTSPRPQLISDWMSGGDLPKYVKKYPDADRPVLVCTPLVGFVAH